MWFVLGPLVVFVLVGMVVLLLEFVFVGLAWGRPEWRRALVGGPWVTRAPIVVLVPLALFFSYAASIEVLDASAGAFVAFPSMGILAVGAWVLVWRLARAGGGTTAGALTPPAGAMLFPRLFWALVPLLLVDSGVETIGACIFGGREGSLPDYRAASFREAVETFSARGSYVWALCVYGVLMFGIALLVVRTVFVYDWAAHRVRVVPFQSTQVPKIILLTLCAPAILGAFLMVWDYGSIGAPLPWSKLFTPFQEALQVVSGVSLYCLLAREAEMILRTRLLEVGAQARESALSA